MGAIGRYSIAGITIAPACDPDRSRRRSLRRH